MNGLGRLICLDSFFIEKTSEEDTAKQKKLEEIKEQKQYFNKKISSISGGLDERK